MEKTIEERAIKFANGKVAASMVRNGYIKGAKEQQMIDIENACEALYGLMYDLGCDILDIDKAKEYMKKVMEGK